MEIIPNGNRVLLELEEQKSLGGIEVPGMLNGLPSDYSRFRVVAVGVGKYVNEGSLIPMQFEPGDYVMIPPPIQISPTTAPRMPCQFTKIGEPEAGGKNLFLIDASDILCKVAGVPKPLNQILLARPADGEAVKRAAKHN